MDAVKTWEKILFLYNIVVIFVLIVENQYIYY